MPDDEHVSWLLEGVDVWNRRRQEKPFQPDLTALPFRDAFQAATHQLDPNGQVRLPDIFLDGARLRLANLSGARLYGASLRGADLFGADLTGAQLEGADLSNADLSVAQVSGTNFHKAVLDGVKGGVKVDRAGG